jgi:predicted amidohydrolase YtcJ
MAWTQRNGLRMARALHARGELPIRTFCMIDANDPELADILEGGPLHDPHAWLSASCIKYFADGAMGSRGALMLEPYLDGTRGLAVTSAARLSEEIPRLAAKGWHIATHAIGDGAARHVIDAYALARAEAPDVLLRLEHAQTMHPDDIARLHDHRVIASVQPIHMYSDSPWAAEVVQAHQLERLYNWRDLSSFTTLCAGSDYPIDDPNPWHGISTFVSRRNAAGSVWRPEQALSRIQALCAYTSGAAKAAGWSRQLGQLYTGFAAELIALPHDPFHCSLKELWDMEATCVELPT